MTDFSSRDTTSKPSSNLFNLVAAAELRTWAPFVRKDAIQAGDILLSRGRGWQSWVIAHTTGGRYSHAAIFLPFRSDEHLPLRLDENLTVDEAKRKYGTFHYKAVSLDLVEADDEGVGAIPPRWLSMTLSGRLHQLVPFQRGKLSWFQRRWLPPKAAVLLRHPCIKSVDEHKLEQAVRTFSDKELIQRYSSADRLVGPLTLPPSLKRVLGRILLWYDPLPERPALLGCFCSELVVKFYDHLGIPLFGKQGAIPEHISPNHLVPPKSLLTAVPDAIVSAADIPDDAQCEVHEEDLRTRFLARFIEMREHTELHLPQYKKEIESLAAMLEKAKEVLWVRGDLGREEQAAAVHARIVDELSDRSIPPSLRRTLDVLLVSSTFLTFLRDHLRSEQVPYEAGSQLRRFHDRAFVKLCSRYSRAQTLVCMSLARRLPAEEGRQVWMRALTNWRSEKARCAQFIADLGPDGQSGDDTDACVRKVLDDVTAKATAALCTT